MVNSWKSWESPPRISWQSPPWVPHQGITYLGQADQLLVSWGTHVQADGKHLLQRGHDEGRVDRIAVPSALLLVPFLIRAT